MPGIGTAGVPGLYDANGNYIGPQISEDFIKACVLSGNAFNVTTPDIGVNFGSNGNTAFGVFNPNGNTKNIFIYSIQVFSAAANPIFLQTVTTEVVFNSAITPVNQNIGNVMATALTGHCTYANSPVTAPTGINLLACVNMQAPGTIELLTNGTAILLPSGSANGLQLYCNINSYNGFAVTLRYIQF